MRIFGQAKPVSVEGVFTSVNVLEKPTAWRKHALEGLQERVGRGALATGTSGQKAAWFRDGANG